MNLLKFGCYRNGRKIEKYSFRKMGVQSTSSLAVLVGKGEKIFALVGVGVLKLRRYFPKIWYVLMRKLEGYFSKTFP